MNRITSNINLIVNELRNGNVVGLPTETVYGLAADATNNLGVEKIFKIKNRPFNHPLIIHVLSDWDLTRWVERTPAYVKKLIKIFWPGPLTLVLKSNEVSNISPLATATQATIAVRSPDHPLAIDVLDRLNRPVVAPSANPFGKISPTEAQHVMQDFSEYSFPILEGGNCNIGIESTILYCIEENECSILRHGSITQSEIQKYCNVSEPEKISSIRVSGNLKSHYQPQKKLFYFYPKDVPLIKSIIHNFEKYYVLCFSLLFEKKNINYLFSSDPKKATTDFYGQLRKADQSDKNIILIELPPETPEWNGLSDKIIKAGISLYPQSR
ncbi:L-threonylcarbamoyladenylate synthase [Legionella sp. 27cVA30]|uniref:L-threonylcarbamoyladenylate synthase n=1 Tax=Legionella sp. 27cVA30 TaxID=2905657 RepID=UPI0020A22EEC|nr:L-threonylcarbamoyladenylate synthase [Legionella sp. 27cVA30]MCP0913571.1 L-threonylcarbamoyladenylate synthase [Legionella sp. 27cVA30]